MKACTMSRFHSKPPEARTTPCRAPRTTPPPAVAQTAPATSPPDITSSSAAVPVNTATPRSTSPL